MTLIKSKTSILTEAYKMKMIGISILLFFPGLINAQDSLKKYSYLVYGFGKDASVPIGTGSFIKIKNKTFFLSSKHVFGGFDSDAKLKPGYPDTLFISIEDKNGRLTGYPIEIAAFKKSNHPTYNFDSPDFILFEIKNPERFKINSIEKFISNKPVTGDSIRQIIGYGFFHKRIESINDLNKLEPLLLTAETRGEYGMYMFLTKFKRIDSLNYYAYPTSYLDLQGASGAPVFQHLNSGKIIFGGVYTASNPEEKLYLFVKPSLILRRLQEKRIQPDF